MLVYSWPNTTTQAIPTSIATHTPTPYSDSPSSRYLPYDFFPPFYPNLQHYYKIFYSDTTNLHRQPYANTVFGFPSSSYLPHDYSSLSTSILTNLPEGFPQALPTSNVTSMPTPPSDSPYRVTHPRFVPVSLPQFTPFL